LQAREQCYHATVGNSLIPPNFFGRIFTDGGGGVANWAGGVDCVKNELVYILGSRHWYRKQMIDWHKSK
ncbi:MAG: hypothetical protein ACK6A7_00675, partial [Planctomycetota bacterium]